MPMSKVPLLAVRYALRAVSWVDVKTSLHVWVLPTFGKVTVFRDVNPAPGCPNQ